MGGTASYAEAVNCAAWELEFAAREDFGLAKFASRIVADVYGVEPSEAYRDVREAYNKLQGIYNGEARNESD